MYHTLTFSTALDFALFSQKIGPWWYELATLRKVQKGEHDCCHALYSSETALDKEHQIDIQGCPMVLFASFNDESRTTTTATEEDNDEIVPLDSQLGRDASALLIYYFPGATITDIQSIYCRGYFVGEYSISMICTVTHPIVEQVKIDFSHEDVSGRPQTWQELCSSLHVDLYLTSLTLRNPSNGHPMTYALPGMYQPEIEQWCKTEQGDLYGHIQTPNLFIITAEGVCEREELKRVLLEVALGIFDKEENPTTNIPLAFRKAFDDLSATSPREQLQERMKRWSLDQVEFPNELGGPAPDEDDKP